MTFTQTASRQCIDLLAPRIEQINFQVDIAEGLAKIARFNGQTSGTFYSDAQHSVLGASAILEATGDRTLAAHFLLHDAHEVFFGDMTRPTFHAIAIEMEDARLIPGYQQQSFQDAVTNIKSRLDIQIFSASGIYYCNRDAFEANNRAIAQWDDRMLRTERDILLGGAVDGYPWWAEGLEPEPVNLAGGYFDEWSWRDAKGRYIGMLQELCPLALAHDEKYHGADQQHQEVHA